MTSDLVLLWGLAFVLIALAVVGLLLPQARRWHTAGVGSLCVLGVVGLGTAMVTTWMAAVLTEVELFDAASEVIHPTDGAPGASDADRVAAFVSDETGHDVSATRVSGSSTDDDGNRVYSYNVSPDGEESPVVCVREVMVAGTPSAPAYWNLDVDPGSCD